MKKIRVLFDWFNRLDAALKVTFVLGVGGLFFTATDQLITLLKTDPPTRPAVTQPTSNQTINNQTAPGIQNSPNVVQQNNSGDQSPNVNVSGGNVDIHYNNYQKSQDYQDLKGEVDRLDAAIKTAQQHKTQHPRDNSFTQELIKHSNEQQVAHKKLADFTRDILKLADEINKIPLNTERLRLAKRYFEAGDFKQARAEGCRNNGQRTGCVA
jgi:hypothetical protein